MPKYHASVLFHTFSGGCNTFQNKQNLFTSSGSICPDNSLSGLGLLHCVEQDKQHTIIFTPVQFIPPERERLPDICPFRWQPKSHRLCGSFQWPIISLALGQGEGERDRKECFVGIFCLPYLFSNPLPLLDHHQTIKPCMETSLTLNSKDRYKYI